MNFIDSPAWILLGCLLALLVIASMAWCVNDLKGEGEDEE